MVIFQTSDGRQFAFDGTLYRFETLLGGRQIAAVQFQGFNGWNEIQVGDQEVYVNPAQITYWFNLATKPPVPPVPPQKDPD